MYKEDSFGNVVSYQNTYKINIFYYQSIAALKKLAAKLIYKMYKYKSTALLYEMRGNTVK